MVNYRVLLSGTSWKSFDKITEPESGTAIKPNSDFLLGVPNDLKSHFICSFTCGLAEMVGVKPIRCSDCATAVIQQM